MRASNAQCTRPPKQPEICLHRPHALRTPLPSPPPPPNTHHPYMRIALPHRHTTTRAASSPAPRQRAARPPTLTRPAASGASGPSGKRSACRTLAGTTRTRTGSTTSPRRSRCRSVSKSSQLQARQAFEGLLCIQGVSAVNAVARMPAHAMGRAVWHRVHVRLRPDGTLCCVLAAVKVDKVGTHRIRSRPSAAFAYPCTSAANQP